MVRKIALLFLLSFAGCEVAVVRERPAGAEQLPVPPQPNHITLAWNSPWPQMFRSNAILIDVWKTDSLRNPLRKVATLNATTTNWTDPEPDTDAAGFYTISARWNLHYP